MNGFFIIYQAKVDEFYTLIQLCRALLLNCQLFQQEWAQYCSSQQGLQKQYRTNDRKIRRSSSRSTTASAGEIMAFNGITADAFVDRAKALIS